MAKNDRIEEAIERKLLSVLEDDDMTPEKAEVIKVQVETVRSLSD